MITPKSLSIIMDKSKFLNQKSNILISLVQTKLWEVVEFTLKCYLRQIMYTQFTLNMKSTQVKKMFHKF